jgi:hypothetical protein
MGENKSKLGLGILIGLLIALVIGLGGFIIYDKVLSDNNESTIEKENNNDVSDTLENTENNEEKELADSDKKQKLEELVLLLHYKSNDLSGKSIGIYKNLSLTSNDKMLVTFRSLNNKNKFTKITIPKDKMSSNMDIRYFEHSEMITKAEVDNEYYALFNERITTHRDIEDCPIYYYDSVNSVYYIYSACGGIGVGGPMEYINKYTYSNDEAYVYLSVGYIHYDNNTEKRTLYTDLQMTKEYQGNYTDDFKINQSNYQNFSEYKYVFGKNDNGNYYFKSIEKTK